jgi:hypothetical protein
LRFVAAVQGRHRYERRIRFRAVSGQEQPLASGSFREN